MPRKNYGDLEQHIIDVILRDRVVALNGGLYTVIVACKPRPSHGECKTDVYVRVENDAGEVVELKISVKSEGTNEFQENKVSAERAEEYFGSQWRSIISNAAMSISDQFNSRPLIFISGKHPTKPNSITLGWKLEIANKPRALSVSAPLSDRQIRDFVYKGTNQDDDKCNAYVDRNRIQNAGVADYLLITSIPEIHTANDVISKMVPIDDVSLPETHLIFTANNYRTDVDKADGPRPLAVCIRWECINNQLCHTIVYDTPLAYTGEGDMKPILLNALSQLGKSHPSDFDVSVDLNCVGIISY